VLSGGNLRYRDGPGCCCWLGQVRNPFNLNFIYIPLRLRTTRETKAQRVASPPTPSVDHESSSPPHRSAPLESKALESVLQQLSINISITFMFSFRPPPPLLLFHFFLFFFSPAPLPSLLFQVPADNGSLVSPRAGIKRLTRKITGLSQRIARDGLLSARFHAVPGHEYVRR
jgi:hypothetical protein